MKLFTPQKLPLFEGGVYLKVVVAKNCFKLFSSLLLIFLVLSIIYGEAPPKRVTFSGFRYMKG